MIWGTYYAQQLSILLSLQISVAFIARLTEQCSILSTPSWAEPNRRIELELELEQPKGIQVPKSNQVSRCQLAGLNKCASIRKLSSLNKLTQPMRFYSFTSLVYCQRNKAPSLSLSLSHRRRTWGRRSRQVQDLSLRYVSHLSPVLMCFALFLSSASALATPFSSEDFSQPFRAMNWQLSNWKRKRAGENFI